MTSDGPSFGKWMAGLGKALATIAILVLALAAGVLLHLDLPVSRRIVAREVNAALADLPWGRVQLSGIERLTPSRVAVRSVELELTGIARARAEHVAVRLDVGPTLIAAIRERRTIALRLRQVEIGLLDVSLSPGPKPAPRETGEKPIEIKVDVDELHLAHAFVHGTLSDGFLVDADLDDLRSSASIDGKRARVAARSALTARAILPQPMRVDVDGSASIPLGSASVRSGSVGLVVKAGDVQLEAHGELEGDSIELELAVPTTLPDAVRTLWEESPFAQPISLRARAGGTLPRLDTRVDVVLGPGTAHVEGRLDLDGGPGAEFAAWGRDVDLRSFGAEYPPSRLTFEADGSLRMIRAGRGEIPLEGAANVSTRGGSLAGEPLPRIEARVGFDRGLRVTADVDERGAPAHVEVVQSGPRRFSGSLEATAASLADVPRLTKLGIPATGRAVLRADASLDDGFVSSRATLDVYRAGFSGVAVGAGRVEARAEGPLRAPSIWASAHLIALRGEPYAVNDLLVRAAGAPDAFDVALAGRGGTFDVVALDARIERANLVHVRDLSARVERGGEVVTIAARDLGFGSDVAQIDGLVIEGLGAPIEASASRARGKLTASVQAPALDLDRLAVILGVDPERLGGKGSMNVSVDVEERDQAANARIRLTGGRFGPVPALDAAVDFGLDGNSVHGLVSVRNQEFGGAHIEADGELGGSLFDRRSLAGSTGRLSLSSDRVSLARVCETLACPDTFKQMASSMRVSVKAEAFVERVERFDGGDTRVHVELEANDARGRLARLGFDSYIDLLRVISTKRFPTDAPLEADFGIEPRSLADLPANLRPVGLSGTVEVHGYAQGTIGKPFFALEIAGHSLAYSGGVRNAPALDLQWVTTYDLEQAASEITVRSAARQVVRASIQADASLERVLAGDPRSWTGGAYVELDRFPLAFLPTDEQRVNGEVSGRISASGLHDKPHVHAHFAADELQIGRDSVGPVKLALEIDERKCVASLDAGAPRGGDDGARAMLRAQAACFWKNATIPGFDPNAPMDIALDATRFPLGALAPVVDTWIERLRGRLDAHLRVTAFPAGDVGSWVVAGGVQVREGNMLPLPIGREIKQLEFDLKAEKGVVRVERIAGEIGGGRFSGLALVHVANAGIETGRAEFHVPKRQAIPLTIEGVSYGTVWGDVFAEAHVARDELLVNVKAPTLRVDLPPQRTAQLESLRDDPTILVLQPLGPPQQQAVGGGPGAGVRRPRRVVLSFELGNNVGISREDMKIELMTADPPGNPKLTFDPEPRLQGAVRILGGRVPVAGRVFRVERGIVRFSGDDPADPALDVDAVYEGTDTSGTRINVHVGGTAKDIKLALSSSPPKSENELLAILAFGEPAPSGGLGAPGTPATGATAAASTAAAGVGSAILTTGVNQLLSQSVLPIRTSLSTGASTLASASVELTERVRVQYIRMIGTSLYGQQLDLNQFALDWRFKPRWLLRTVVGDRGTTTLDILWNRWY